MNHFKYIVNYNKYTKNFDVSYSNYRDYESIHLRIDRKRQRIFLFHESIFMRDPYT